MPKFIKVIGIYAVPRRACVNPSPTRSVIRCKSPRICGMSIMISNECSVLPVAYTEIIHWIWLDRIDQRQVIGIA